MLEDRLGEALAYAEIAAAKAEAEKRSPVQAYTFAGQIAEENQDFQKAKSY